MFRVVSSFVENPFYLVICDDTTCDQFIRAEIPSALDIHGTNPLELFVKSAVHQGWCLSITGHVCPGHHVKALEQLKAAKQQQLVHSANGTIKH